ncbi:MAG: DUF2071 domain-containing protein [Caldilineales bacterium]
MVAQLGRPRVFLSAFWRYLVMLNYEIDPAILAPLTPPGTELDSWNGRTFASMVGFLFLDTRVLGVPIPLHRDFEEVNLRFYVRRRDPLDGWRRGVVFVKEIVPRPAIAWTARLLYGERYVALPMRHQIVAPQSGSPVAVEYGWRHRGRWQRLGLRPTGVAQPIARGSEEEFITEHYWGYASQRGGQAVEYQVEHPRWRVWQAADSWLDCDAATLYGPQFAECLSVASSSAFLADGSDVTVRQGRPLTGR